MMMRPAYALVTAARNEEQYIRNTLQSVVEQTLPPKVWVIVSDGSTDRTDDIVREYIAGSGFIRLVRIDNRAERDFSSKVFALHAGYNDVTDLAVDYVGFIDADVALPGNYYEQLLARFAAHPRLGLAGGAIVEERNGSWERRYADSLKDVGGQMPLFRRKCYDDIGGFLPLRWGGEDAAANVLARRAGWDVRVFTELQVRHYRHTGTADMSVYGARLRNGREDYFLGYHPLFEMGKAMHRILEPPYVFGCILRLCGYFWPWLKGETPMVDEDFVRHVRGQQLRRLFAMASGRSAM
jgi:glycosyltransferase involved in cell wall biosynthesis